jgi:hypothetical protein
MSQDTKSQPGSSAGARKVLGDDPGQGGPDTAIFLQTESGNDLGCCLTSIERTSSHLC